MPNKPNRKPYFVISSLIIAFIIPIAAALTLYNHKEMLKNPDITTYSITPPLSLAEFNPKILDGQNQTAQLPKQWTIALADPTTCSSSNCQTHITRLKQIKLALGKYQNQLNIALIINHSPADKLIIPALHRHIPNLYLIKIANPHLTKLLGTKNTASLNLISPNGHVSFKFPTATNNDKLYRTLKKLIGG